jgi:hypothetical protein
MTLADDLEALQRPIVAGTARVLVLDIERLPGLAWVWEPKTRYVSPRQFEAWPSLLCFAAVWYDRPDRVIFSAEWHKGGHEGMVRKAWELLNAADIVVGYNSIAFDMKHLRSEFLLAGLDPPAPWRDVDLYANIKRIYGFESKSMDTVTKRLGLDGKRSHYSIETALSAVRGNRDAQRDMKTYNVADVVDLTLPLYDRLRPWLRGHPHLGTWGNEARCDRCGSGDLEPIRKRYRAPVHEYRMARCRACGGVVKMTWEARQSNSRGV